MRIKVIRLDLNSKLNQFRCEIAGNNLSYITGMKNLSNLLYSEIYNKLYDNLNLEIDFDLDREIAYEVKIIT